VLRSAIDPNWPFGVSIELGFSPTQERESEEPEFS